MRHCIRAVMVAVLALCSFGATPLMANAQGNVNGTVYTSPNYGYQLQWSDPWFFYEETSEGGLDSLVISSGVSDASFVLAFAPGTTLDGLLQASMSVPQPDVSSVQPMLDAQGNPVRGFNGDQEWAVYTATQTFDDGSTIGIVQYFNLRSLEGGVMLAMYGVTVEYFWDDASLQSWHDLADTSLVTAAPAAPIATEAPITAPTAPAAPTESPATLKPTMVPPVAGEGEPAPAFAAGPWRIAIRAVDAGEAIEYLGLGFVDGQQWVVVYADVTNWSSADAQLDIAGMTLVTANGAIAPDTASTQSTATQLGLEPANGSTVLVPANGSIRVALVYSIPVSEDALMLEMAGNQLPLEDAVGQQLDVTDLSTIATPPSLIQGTMGVMPLEGPEVEFFVQTSEGSVPISLAGVEIPTDLACFDSSSTMIAVAQHFGERLWLEADPAIGEPNTYYVWYEDDQGNRVLLNQQVIAEGAALESDLPESARFGAWLEQTEAVAEEDGTGLWFTCTGQI